MFLPEMESGTLVRFKLNSVVCPETEMITEKITDLLEVTGRVVYLSDSGQQVNHFAVVEVDGILTPMVVPIDSVEVLNIASQEDNAEMTSM